MPWVKEGCCAVTSDWDLFSAVLAGSWLETDIDTMSLKMLLSFILLPSPIGFVQNIHNL